jgi:hypothetical protein
VVLPDEDAAEFAALEAALIEELAPAGVLQSVLVQRIAAAAWRLSRAERLETELFAENGLPDGTLGLALIRDGNRAGAFGTLLRYRSGALAEFWRALRTLKALQAEGAGAASHAGNAIPRPAAAAAPAARPNEPNRRGVPAESAAEHLQLGPDNPDPAPTPPRPHPPPRSSCRPCEGRLPAPRRTGAPRSWPGGGASRRRLHPASSPVRMDRAGRPRSAALKGQALVCLSRRGWRPILPQGRAD